MTMEDLGFKDVGPVKLSPEHVAMVEAYSKVEDETMAVEMIKNAYDQETDKGKRAQIKTRLKEHKQLLQVATDKQAFLR